MSPIQIKLAAYGVAALLLWLLRPRAVPTAHGDVELGTGTVGGIYGGDYQTPRPAPADPGNRAVDPEMRRLIDQSNLLIAGEGAP